MMNATNECALCFLNAVLHVTLSHIAGDNSEQTEYAVLFNWLNCVIEYGLCIKDELLVISEHVCLYIKVLHTTLSNAITFARHCLMLFEAAELYDHARKTQTRLAVISRFFSS